MVRLSEIAGIGSFALASISIPYGNSANEQPPYQSGNLAQTCKTSATSQYKLHYNPTKNQLLDEIIANQLACKSYGDGIKNEINSEPRINGRNAQEFVYEDGFAYGEGPNPHIFATKVSFLMNPRGENPSSVGRLNYITVFADEVSLAYNASTGMLLASIHDKAYDLSKGAESYIHKGHRGHRLTYPVQNQNQISQEQIRKLMDAASEIIKSKYSGSLSTAQVQSFDRAKKLFMASIGAKPA